MERASVTAAKDFFPNLANYIKKVEDDESELSDLKASLSALDSHLASTGTSYLTSDELSTLDLSLAPQLHHMAVALDAYKPTSYPASSAFEEFKEVKKYVDVITKERAFLSAKDYEDEVVVWGWTEPVNYMIDTYGFEHSFQNVLDYVNSLIPEPVLLKLEPALLKLMDSFPDEYALEISGIWSAIDAKGHGDKITVGQLAAINLMYELTVFCTSVLAEDQDGNIYHGRNLDYGISGLQNLTANIDFTSSGEVRYRGTEFVGYVGLLTGMKPAAFSFSVDQREMIDQHKNSRPKWEAFKGVIENVISGLSGGKPVGMFLRKLAEEGTSYDSALSEVAAVELIAPVYIMLAGTGSGEAAVVTRGRLRPDDQVDEGVWTVDVGEGAWWRAETNYDHWVDVPDSDDRRGPVNGCMEKLGQENAGLEGIYNCLSTPPVLCDGTVYTTLMMPKNDEYEVEIRNQD
ncbi:hypothetical protein TrRE_jg13040 [Triparma retinervis]|uniref:GST C-terminal domain-containing protein n=1 Tax=Triparma retinervis TaxID=2557542 RepID=A0A9W7A4A1_9STRA|nr:hypothetical protein TrRE_jg13040 [Triparma retinervis]